MSAEEKVSLNKRFSTNVVVLIYTGSYMKLPPLATTLYQCRGANKVYTWMGVKLISVVRMVGWVANDNSHSFHLSALISDMDLGLKFWV
jgi:hypothetical protein